MKETPKKKSIFEILQCHFPPNEFALMQEVSDSAGFARSRSADYIAVNMWPSRGLAIHGIELKSYRGDWLNEKKNPKKAENIFQYCDYFWLLTEDETIAKLEEVPDTWGWMTIKAQKITIKKSAPKLQPIDLDKGFVIAMLKRACDRSAFVHRESIADQLKKAREDGEKYEKQISGNRLEEIQKLKKFMSDFQRASGIDIMNEWKWRDGSGEKIGHALKQFMEGGAEKYRKELEHLQTTVNRMSHEIGVILSQIKMRI